MLAHLMKEAPKGGFTYRQMAAAFIQSDLDYNDGHHARMLGEVFANRKILGNSAELVETQTAPETYRPMTVSLDGSRFGPFQGALVESEVAGHAGFAEDQVAAQELKDHLASLIEAGEINYLRPDQQASMANLIKPDGHPYMGFTTYRDGQMIIERSRIRD